MEIAKDNNCVDAKNLLKVIGKNKKLIFWMSGLTVLITALANLSMPRMYMTRSEIRLALRGCGIFYERDIACKDFLGDEKLGKIYALLDPGISFDIFKQRIIIRPMYSDLKSIEIINWAESPSMALEINERLTEDFVKSQEKSFSDYINSEMGGISIERHPGYQSIKGEIERTRLRLLKDLEQIRKMVKQEEEMRQTRTHFDTMAENIKSLSFNVSAFLESDESKASFLRMEQAQIVKKAELPKRPFSPRTLLNTLLAGMISFVLSVGYIVLKQ